MRQASFLILLAFAGCVSAPAEEGAPSPAAADDPAPVQLTACRQVHSYFPSPAAPFEAFVPEGFAMVKADPTGATVDVRVEATLCAEGSEVWVEIPVEPPAELAENGLVHTAPVVGYASSPELVAWHAPRLPDRVFEATIALAAADNDRYSLSVRTATEDYSWEGALQGGGAPFGAETLARWMPTDGGVSGHLRAEGSESMTVGFGPVGMVYRGNGGAPPVASGIAHVVEDLTLVRSFVALDASSEPRRLSGVRAVEVSA